VNIYRQAPRLLSLIDEFRPLVEASCSREALERYFASAGDTGEERIQMAVSLFFALPSILSEFVKDSVQQAAASIPAKVGPPLRLTPEIKRQIVESVGRLHIGGLGIGVAQFRVAQQLNLSKRTVQGVWRQRQALSQQPFQSIGDVWVLIKKQIQAR
jgi:hypothetical protein